MRKLFFILWAATTSLSLSAAVQETAPVTQQGPPSFSAPAKVIRPSVVNINTERNIVNEFVPRDDADPNSQFFKRFFGVPRQYTQHSLGSGVIIDAAAGYVLTNNHVVDKVDQIKVRLSDESEVDAKVVGTDPKTDLAVIQLKGGKDLVAARFGDSEAMEVGDWVLAVGSPFGFEQTVSHGIISAKGRSLPGGPYEDFLQTDAPINPGNSGGPLVNLRGEVVGINTAISSSTGGSQGIGFAIPSNLVHKIYQELVQHGKVTRGWLGVSIQPLTKSLVRHFGLPAGAKGALITEVIKNGPAEKAGLRSGDVVTEIDGRAVADTRALQNLVAETRAGSTVNVKVWRNGAIKEIKVQVAEMSATAGEEFHRRPQGEKPNGSKVKLGLSVDDLTSEEATRRGIKDGYGVLVTDVVPGSPAEEAGVQAGDVILEMENAKIQNTAQLRKLAGGLKAGQSVVMRITRDGHPHYISIDIK